MIDNKYKVTNYKPRIGNKVLGLKFIEPVNYFDMSSKNNKVQATPKIIFSDINLDSCTLESVVSDLNLALDLVTCSHEDLIKLITNLFYNKQAKEFSKIFKIINNAITYDQTFDESNYTLLEELNIICDNLLNRMKNIKITKFNSVVRNDENFDVILKSQIKNIQAYIKEQININKILSERDFEKIGMLVEEKIHYIDKLNELMSNEVKLDYTDRNNTGTHMVSLGLYSDMSASRPICKEIGQGISGHDDLNIAMVNMGAGFITGVSWAMYKNSQSGINVAIRQSIRLEKLNLLKLVYGINKTNYWFTDAQLRKFGDFLNIKCGEFFDNLFTSKTKSYKEFCNIISNRHNDEKSKIEKEPLKQIDQVLSMGDDAKAEDGLILENKLSCKMISKIENFYTSEDIKVKLENLIQNEQELLNYLKMQKKTLVNKKLIATIVLDTGIFRGNLLAYISNSNNNELKEEIDLLYADIKNEVTIDGFPYNTKPYTINQLYEINYIQFSELLRSYNVVDKQQCLIDIVHVCYAIKKNERLNQTEQRDLLVYLNNQIERKDEGVFARIRLKNRKSLSNFCQRSIFAGAMFNGRNARVYSSALEYSTPTDMFIAGGVGYSWYSALNPVIELFSRGDTTTFKIVRNTIQNTLKSIPSQDIDNDSPILESDNKEVGERRNSSYLKMPIDIIKLEILDTLKNSDALVVDGYVKSLLNKLNEDRSIKVYLLLTETVGDSFLLDYLYGKLYKKDQLFDQLNALWNKVIKEKCVNEINQISGDNYLHFFKKYIGKLSFNIAKSALYSFYEIMAIINNCSDQSKKAEMLTYFNQVIARAKSDPTSKWHLLLKRSEIAELSIRIAIRIVGAFIWGSVSGLTVVTKAVMFPVAITIILLAGGVRGFIYGLSNNYKNATILKTIEYRAARKYLKKIIDRNPNVNAILDNNPILPQKMLTITDACKRAYKNNQSPIINGNTISNYLIRNVNSADQCHIDNLKNVSNNSEACCTELNKIINEITAEVVDKYTANEALFRIISIIYSSVDSKLEQLKLIIALAFLFKDRVFEFAKKISTDRSFYTQRNYMLPDISYGLFASVNTLVGLPAFDLLPIYQTLSGSVGYIASECIINLGLRQYISNNTHSFSICMSFLKDILLDLLNDVPQIIDGQNNEELEQLMPHMNAIISTHTSRHWFTKIEAPIRKQRFDKYVKV